jgi:membrane protein YdbS with pleckstrin-like domain
MSKSPSSSSGIGFSGLLTIVFIVLKLIGKIDWSWWWVLSPIWISISLVLIFLIGAVGIAFYLDK